MIVGGITAREHRARVHVPMTANTGTAVYIDLDADAAVEFLEGLLAEAPDLGVPGLPIWIDKSLEGSLYPVSLTGSAVNRSTRIQTIRMLVTFQLQGDRSL
jgi:hypothetical protein